MEQFLEENENGKVIFKGWICRNCLNKVGLEVEKIYGYCDSCGAEIKTGDKYIQLASISKYYNEPERYCQACNELNLSEAEIKAQKYIIARPKNSDLDKILKVYNQIDLPYKLDFRPKGDDLEGYFVEFFQNRKYLDDNFGQDRLNKDEPLKFGLAFDLAGKFLYGCNFKE
jgi:hypothetical protein